jgi:hypothetical protein
VAAHQPRRNQRGAGLAPPHHEDLVLSRRRGPCTPHPAPLGRQQEVDQGRLRAATYNGRVSNPDLQAAAERLRQTLDLFEAGLSMKRAQLRREHPEATDGEIEALLQVWLGRRAGAENGDAPGRLRQLDTRSA